MDPYLDAEFISRYLPHVVTGVGIRLLAHKYMATLLAAVDMYVLQTGTRYRYVPRLASMIAT